MRKLTTTLIILITFSFVQTQANISNSCPSGSTASRAFERSQPARRVRLTKNARKNGYTTKKQGNTIYFQANNVEDPFTAKLIGGLKQMEYACQLNQALGTVELQFSGGRSNSIAISCLDLVQPQIILMEESEQ